MVLSADALSFQEFMNRESLPLATLHGAVFEFLRDRLYCEVPPSSVPRIHTLSRLKYYRQGDRNLDTRDRFSLKYIV